MVGAPPDDPLPGGRRLQRNIVRAVRRMDAAVDVQTASEFDLEGVDDLEVLRRAAADERLLLTHDKRTMPRHFSAFLDDGRSSYGVLVIGQHLPIGPVARSLVGIWETMQAEDWIDRLEWLRV